MGSTRLVSKRHYLILILPNLYQLLKVWLPLISDEWWISQKYFPEVYYGVLRYVTYSYVIQIFL